MRRHPERPRAADGIATTRQPTFGGTAAAFWLVHLNGESLKKKHRVIYLGETIVSPDGSWALTTGRNPTGKYAVTARVTPPGGFANQPTLLTSNGGIFVIGFSSSKTRAAVRVSPALVARSISAYHGRS